MGKLNGFKIILLLIPIFLAIAVYSFFIVTVDFSSEEVSADIPVVYPFPWFVVITIILVVVTISLYLKGGGIKNEEL